MRTLRYPLIGAALILSIALMVGCAPRGNVSAVDSEASADAVVISLPAIVLDVDEEGHLTASNVAVTQLNPLLDLALADATLPTDLVEDALAADVQHVQLETTPNGLIILVNNEPIMSPLWNEEVLNSTGETLSNLGVGLPEGMTALLPVLSNAGLGAVLQFPGAASDPVPSSEAPGEIPSRPSNSTQITIDYNADGTWSGSGIPPFPPLPWDMIFTLPADTIQSLSEAGIESLQLTTSSDGIFLRVNGEDLPFIDWSGNRLGYTLQVLADMGLLGDQVAGMLPTISGFLPMIQGLSLDITMNFPQA